MGQDHPQPPHATPITEPQRESTRGAFVGKDWLQWFLMVTNRLNQTPVVVSGTTQAARTTALPPTAIPKSEAASGVYRMTYYARIETPSGGSSSLTVRFTWTDGGVVQTYTGPAITGNTTATMQSNTFLLTTDRGTAVYYETLYSSSPAGMAYTLTISAEAMP